MRLTLLRHRRPQRLGRPWSDDRDCLEDIFFVLQSGIAWALLLPQFGVGGMTCWRRVRDWKMAGVWQRVHTTLLKGVHVKGVHAARQLEPRVAVADSTNLRAVKAVK